MEKVQHSRRFRETCSCGNFLRWSTMNVPTFLPLETKYEYRMWIWSAFIDSLLRHCSLHRVKDYVRVSLWPSVFIVRDNMASFTRVHPALSRQDFKGAQGPWISRNR